MFRFKTKYVAQKYNWHHSMQIDLADIATVCRYVYGPGLHAEPLPDRFQTLIFYEKRWGIFFDKESGECVVALKGTHLSDLDDLIANMHVLTGTFENHNQTVVTVTQILQIMHFITSHYDVHMVVFAGHSLAARYAVLLHEKYCDLDGMPQSCAIGFNTLTTPIDNEAACKTCDRHVLHLCVAGDIVSQWQHRLCGEKWQIIPNEKEHFLSKHSISTMIGRVNGMKYTIPKVARTHRRICGLLSQRLHTHDALSRIR